MVLEGGEEEKRGLKSGFGRNDHEEGLGFYSEVGASIMGHQSSCTIMQGYKATRLPKDIIKVLDIQSPESPKFI